MTNNSGIDNSEVLQRLARLETKMDMIISVKDTTHATQESVKSAHKRIDDLERLPVKMAEVKTKVDRHESYLFWATTSGLLGVIGLVLTIYSLITR